MARGVTTAAEGSGPPASTSPAVDRFELDEATIADLQKRMESGPDSARSLAEKYLARIDGARPAGTGAPLRSSRPTPTRSRSPTALDSERKAGKAARPAARHPGLLKDNIDTADRMMTTAGSLALEGTMPPRTPSSSRGCARRAPSSSARRT